MPLTAVWRLLRAVLHGAHGAAIVLLRFPRLGPAQRHARIAWWSAKMLRLLGLRQVVEGRFAPGAKLIVANHVSWLDIMALHAVQPQARFVSKADVQRWPLVKRLVAGADTLYLDRGSRRDALRVVRRVAAALQAGDSVAVFPEGTTGAGPELLPFHANLLQAAISTGTPVQPVVLRYADRHARFSAAAEFLGATTLARSLWRLAGGDGLVVHLTVLPLQSSAGANRRELAERLRRRMAVPLQAPAAAVAAQTVPARAQARVESRR